LCSPASVLDKKSAIVSEPLDPGYYLFVFSGLPPP
jgi:hypothetical protein